MGERVVEHGDLGQSWAGKYVRHTRPMRQLKFEEPRREATFDVYFRGWRFPGLLRNGVQPAPLRQSPPCHVEDATDIDIYMT